MFLFCSADWDSWESPREKWAGTGHRDQARRKLRPSTSTTQPSSHVVVTTTPTDPSKMRPSGKPAQMRGRCVGARRQDKADVTDNTTANHAEEPNTRAEHLSHCDVEQVKGGERQSSTEAELPGQLATTQPPAMNPRKPEPPGPTTKGRTEASLRSARRTDPLPGQTPGHTQPRQVRAKATYESQTEQSHQRSVTAH